MWFQAPYDMYIDAVRPVAALLEFGGWWEGAWLLSAWLPSW